MADWLDPLLRNRCPHLLDAVMPLPVQPLSSLASRAVLSLDLDTRELPLHLHRELEGYRGMEGAFTLREVVFEVVRSDGLEVSEEEREEGWQFYVRNKMMVTDPDTEKMMETKNKWCVGQPLGQRSTVLYLENPVEVLHHNQVGTSLTVNLHHMKVHRATNLDNGKIVAVTTVEEEVPELG